MTDGKSPFLGHHLASKLISVLRDTPSVSRKQCDQSCVSTFAILLEELCYRTDDERPVHLDVIVAVYIAFAESLGKEACAQLDNNITKTSKSLAPLEFAHVLGLISDSLSAANVPTSQLVQLVHLSVVLLHDHPQSE